jgi:carbon-monoxide dehydrogenase catalytic subunit
VTQVLTSTAKDLFGGYFIVEPDPIKASAQLLSAMAERRKGLGLSA